MTVKSERARLLLAIAVVVPAGLAVKFCVPEPLGTWCNLYGAAILYEVLWVLVLRLLWPRWAPLVCGAAVFVGTCALEFLQLWHPPMLEAVRATFIGAVLLGSSFDPWDFLYYAIGSALGVSVAWVVRRISGAHD